MALKDKYTTISEVAKEYNVTRQTVYRWIHDGNIETETVGNMRLINKKSLARFLQKRIDEMKKSIDEITKKIEGMA